MSIVNDILDFSKSENNMQLENVSFNTNDLFEEIIELYLIKANSKKIQLEYEPNLDIPRYVFGDPVKLKQVITNLLSNAIKFTSESGLVKLSVNLIDKNDKYVSLLFTVSDNGIGISKENQDRIFNSFEQAEPGTTRNFGGTGLGLAISKRFVNAMGGDIELESKEGVGSSFSFQLSFTIDFSSIVQNTSKNWDMKFGVCCKDTVCPVYRERIVRYLEDYGEIIDDFADVEYDNLDAIFVFYNHDIINRFETIRSIYKDIPIIFVGNINQLAPNEKKYINDVIDEPIYGAKVSKMLHRYYNHKFEKRMENISKKYSGTVLVAEDNMVNKHLIDVLLKKYGINASFAANGEEAIVTYRECQPDLILMDIHMPLMDGITATRKITEIKNDNSSSKQSIIVALTADVLGSEVKKYKDHGFSDYIAKPIVIGELEKILAKYLNNEEIISETINSITSSYKYDINIASQELGLGVDDISMLLTHFFSQLDEQISEIKIELESKNKDNLKHKLHNLKGSSANLRFNDASEMLKNMENMVKNDELEKINILSIEKYFEQMKNDLKSYIS